ncbi:NUDIX domain-containing protein [Streptomyces sp. NPDC054933]
MTQPGVLAAVIVQDGRVLLVRRAVAEGVLRWQFPAGKVESGETAAQAAVWEAAEEAGLAVEAVRALGDRVHPATGRRIAYAACRVVLGTAVLLRPDGHVAWVGDDQQELVSQLPRWFG